MGLDHSNSSNLEQLALKGLKYDKSLSLETQNTKSTQNQKRTVWYILAVRELSKNESLYAQKTHCTTVS